MALLIEKRSGMQNIFLQANCKMHEANYPSSAAYAEAGRILQFCYTTPSRVTARAVPCGAPRGLSGLLGNRRAENCEEGY